MRTYYSYPAIESAYQTVEDEGIALPQQTIIDFQGAGVTVTDGGTKTIVTIPGGGGVTPAALTNTDDTNVALVLTGTPASALLQAVNIAVSWVGTLADSRIASAATWNAKEPPITPGTTSQYWRGDKTWQTFPTIPTVTPSALTKTDDTNVTLTLGGTPATALLQAVSLTLGWTGTLADSRIASASTWNAKQDAISLTTTGSSGAATFLANVLNIPNYTLSGLGGVPTSRQITINGTTYDLSADRTWTVGDLLSSGSYSNPTWITSLAWSKITGAPAFITGITSSDVTTALGYTPVTNARTITINGTTYDLSANRTWSVGDVLTSGSYADPTWITSLAYSKLTGAPTIPTVGTWGALNYPTWVSGTPFVKMTAAGTFALDTNTYLTSITSSNVTTALGYTPVTNARTITINGTSYDLTADRTWTVGDVLTSGSYANPSWITSLAWSKITSAPTVAEWKRYSSNTFNPADSTTYYISTFQSLTPTTAITLGRQFKFMKAGTSLTVMYQFVYTGIGSSESVTAFIRNTTTSTNTTLGTFTLDGGANATTYFTFTVALAVNTTDIYALGMTCPAWVTNPTGVYWAAEILNQL